MANQKKYDPLRNALNAAKMRTKELVDTGYEEDEMYVTITFSRGSKKVETIEKGKVSSLNNLVRNAHNYLEKGDGYDNIKIEWRSADGVVLKFQSDTINAQPGQRGAVLPPAAQLSGMDGGVGGGVVLAGFGGAPNTMLSPNELDELLQKRIEEHDRKKEYEQLQRDVQRLESEVATHKARAEELEGTVAAKNKIENTLGMISGFLPGISRLLGTDTPLGKTLAGLAGIGPEEEAAKPSTVADMVREYVARLDKQQQDGVYLLFTAIESDPELLPQLIRMIANKKPPSPADAPQNANQDYGNFQ